MKMLKVLALGTLLALTTACSKDKDSCSPAGEMKITMEQLYQKNQQDIFVNQGVGSSYQVGRVDGLRYDSGDTFYAPMDPGYEDMLAGLPDFKLERNNGKRFMVNTKNSTDTSLLAPYKKKRMKSYVRSSLQQAYVIQGAESELSVLKSKYDDVLRTEAEVQVCSSEIHFLLVEDEESGSNKSMVLRYDAKVR